MRNRHTGTSRPSTGVTMIQDYAPLRPAVLRALRRLAHRQTEPRSEVACSLCGAPDLRNYKLRHRMIVCLDCYETTNTTHGI